MQRLQCTRFGTRPRRARTKSWRRNDPIGSENGNGNPRDATVVVSRAFINITYRERNVFANPSLTANTSLGLTSRSKRVGGTEAAMYIETRDVTIGRRRSERFTVRRRRGQIGRLAAGSRRAMYTQTCGRAGGARGTGAGPVLPRERAGRVTSPAHRRLFSANRRSILPCDR
ncbi:hypothetical protein EVAR_41043_1 [Eumeta japonica]|uniref:Uncharacterized protein n=1 Tax=Eumeta variegata TaxID=151549 RepID=A0A4C1Z349_EUMVA|nr:hypothetical protein EVAR_41043_1 [Eumeta japonica]